MGASIRKPKPATDTADRAPATAAATANYQSLALDQCDPDQLTEVIHGTDMHHRLLPGGARTVVLEKLRIGTGSLQRGRYGMGILVNGAWPRGLVTVGVVLQSPTEAIVNGFACPPPSLQLYAEGCELTYRAAPGSAWIAYCVERERIQRSALKTHGRPLPVPRAGCLSIRLEPQAGWRIAATIQALLAPTAANRPSGAIDPCADALEEQLHFEIARALDTAGSLGGCRELRQADHRRRLMARAEEYLRENLSEPFSLSGFADSVGVSPRMLEHHFRRAFGVTPSTWHRCMKLDAARRDLQKARATGERIAEIAMRRGFLHLGRFSQEYRQLFGERPRDTVYRP